MKMTLNGHLKINWKGSAFEKFLNNVEKKGHPLDNKGEDGCHDCSEQELKVWRKI